MIKLGDTIISDDIIEEHFVCDLSKCKGACCIEGDAGAPLDVDEISYLEDYKDEILPYLTEEGRATIEKEGVFDYDEDGELVTPLNDGEECAFTIYEDGVAFCGIEKAFNEGMIDFRKPISCHLYPIRIIDYKMYSALNYHRWPICSDACELGNEMKVPIYKFTKDALIRKYGQKWYDELEVLAVEYVKYHR
jgi:hypothetical protein